MDELLWWVMVGIFEGKCGCIREAESFLSEKDRELSLGASLTLILLVFFWGFKLSYIWSTMLFRRASLIYTPLSLECSLFWGYYLSLSMWFKEFLSIYPNSTSLPFLGSPAML